ncbi:MAG TPA: DHH family phosphoesterase, partial [Patescibacteria group bacterium]|nr:DHH family phosphoesterase [Patescibacteria group bacterium]
MEKKRWLIADRAPEQFHEEIGIASSIFAQLLWNRGIQKKEDLSLFSEPSWEHGIHDPFLFSRMHEATGRVMSAIQAGEHITIHGDYDADGITASALMITVLKEIHRSSLCGDSYPAPPIADIDFYIPHRDKEGYGLHHETVLKLKERGTNLLITVDCGIASVDEIAFARSLGMDVVVVDHHQFGDRLPEAILIHPGLSGETYPFKSLAAVGVAFKFACALLTKAREQGCEILTGWEKWLLDLVAIATVTDMVPLIGENRALLTFGLRVLNKTRRLG